MFDNKLKTPFIALIGAVALLASAPAFAQNAAPAAPAAYAAAAPAAAAPAAGPAAPGAARRAARCRCGPGRGPRRGRSGRRDPSPANEARGQDGPRHHVLGRQACCEGRDARPASGLGVLLDAADHQADRVPLAEPRVG